MIGRIWRGWTTPANADAFEALARSEILPACLSRGGLEKIQLLRCVGPLETEFMTILWFDGMDAARTFAGDHYQQTIVPPKARELLLRFDARSEDFDLRKVTVEGCDVPSDALWSQLAPAWWRPPSVNDGHSPMAHAAAATAP